MIFFYFQVGLGGKQLLFTSPVLALRHDIDALLFVPCLASTSLSFTHTATFNALGYVQASKKEKKFLTCSSDGSIAALCDTSRHLFVYCQPSEGVKGQSALQFVCTLTDNETILGLKVCNEKVVYILLESVLVVLKLVHQ